MNALAIETLSFAVPDGWVAIALECAFKGTLILILAVGAASLLRAASAAARHLVWSLAVLSLLALPLFSAVLPQWTVALPGMTSWGRMIEETMIPSREGFLEGSQMEAIPQVTRSMRGDGSSEPVSGATRDALSLETREGPSSPAVESSWESRRSTPRYKLPFQLMLLWGAGVGLLLLRLIVDAVRIARRATHAHQITDPKILRHYSELSARLKLSRRVALLSGNRGDTPITWGWIQPVILLPPEHASWTSERLRRVLLHELIHVRRNDFLVQIVTEVVRALYWFHPLVWIAVHQLRVEQELACDDAVLLMGVRPTEYAEDLIAIARSIGNSRRTAMSTLQMAGPSQLQGRVRALLDKGRRRTGGSPLRFAIGGIIAIASAAPLAAIHPAELESAIPDGLIGNPAVQGPPGTELSSDQIEAPYVSRDSAGVHIVTSPATSWPSGASWTIDPVPVMDLDFREGIRAAAINSEGRVAVIDAGGPLPELSRYVNAGMVRIFGADGREIANLGHAQPDGYDFVSLVWTTPDTLLLWDYGGRMLSWLTDQGAVRRHSVAPAMAPYSARINSTIPEWALSPNGALLATWMTGEVIDDLWLLRRALYLMPADSQAMLELGEFPTSEILAVPARQDLSNPFAHRTSFELGANPVRAFVAESDRWEISVYGNDGEVTGRIQAAIPRIPVTEEMVEVERERLRDLASELGVSSAVYLDALDRFAIPDSLPAIHWMGADPIGNLWVSRRVLPASRQREIVLLDVIGPDGNWLGSVLPPPDPGRILDISDNRLVTASLAEGGGSRLRVYRIQK